MTQYTILSKETKLKLEIAVTQYLKEGWRPKGGVSYDSNRKEFLQAMIKG